MRLVTLLGSFGICTFQPDAALPGWLPEGAFYSVTRTTEELSVVSPTSAIPETVACERDWRCFRVQGPLDFSLTGVLASLAAPLAEAEISIFAVSTYNTDYLLVQEAQFARAKRALTEAGHQVTPEGDEKAA